MYFFVAKLLSIAVMTYSCILRNVYLINAVARGEPSRISGLTFYLENYRVLGLSVDEDFVILDCVVLTQYHRVTDRQTDIPIIANTGLCSK